jgi:hypothetical protein
VKLSLSKLKVVLSVAIAALLTGAVVGTAGPGPAGQAAQRAVATALQAAPSIEASAAPSAEEASRLAPQPAKTPHQTTPPTVMRPCVLRENAVPPGQCWCPPPFMEQPSRIPCALPCPWLGAAAPQVVVPCPSPCPWIDAAATQVVIPCPLPPAPPVLGQPAIWWCPTPLIREPAPGTVPSRGALLCGRGFHASELVTVTLTSVRGVQSWVVTASPTGSIATPLGPMLCRLAPASVTAVGAQGDRSNSLALPGPACL